MHERILYTDVDSRNMRGIDYTVFCCYIMYMYDTFTHSPWQGKVGRKPALGHCFRAGGTPIVYYV